MMQREKLLNVCFVGTARYCNPLGLTDEKKFQALSALARIFVIGFSRDLRPRRFTQHVSFYLLPELPLAFLRYIEMFTLAPVLALWFIFRHRVRVLVAQSPYEGVAAAVAKLVAGWFGTQVVLVVESHGNFEEDLFLQHNVGLPSVYRFLMSRAARFSLKQADLLRAISHSTRQQVEQWKPGQKIVQFATWTDIEVFLEAGRHRDAEFNPLILYAGVLIPRKGVLHLVNAFIQLAEAFPAAALVLIGKEESPSYSQELRELVQRHQLTQRVRFVPALDQKELAARMAQACVFMLPSYSEGLGRVVVEAMAAGTPVIGSRVGGIPDMIGDGETGFLVPPGDEPALAEKMRWVLEHQEAARQMGQHAQTFARTFFSTERYVDGYRQIFEAAADLLSGQ